MGQGVEKASQKADDAIFEAVMEATGGDVKAAVVGLVRGQEQLLDEVAKVVSAGYVRRGRS